jgi:EAL domain-containing protein (putative c-di-GMP-specific phosphodiesterase class I)/CheY-like chemotaxis protein
MTAGKILVIDDDSDVGEFVSAAARELGLECASTTDAAALSSLYTVDTNLILLDLMMPDMDGIEVLRMLSEQKVRASIVLMSGISKRVIETAEKLAEALGLSIGGHLEKPFRLAELEAILTRYASSETSTPVRESPRVVIPDAGLRGAIKNNEFVVHYQPQIDIVSGDVVGVEALARWQHPERGLIYPDNFIDRAEKLGLIDDLGWLIANRGMAEVKQFAGEDGVVPRLALNVSVHSLRDLRFPDTFIATMRNHGIAPDGVIVEITESGLINELSHTLDVLTRLRMKDIQLSIDDFGTGYAMMQQLVNIPATELKIDKIFVLNMKVNGSDRVMVQKTIEIGHELGMRVIAEGVETREHLDFLSEKRCDSAQGYFFSRPQPAKEMAKWLEAYRHRPGR